jgi:hypothetical protein
MQAHGARLTENLPEKLCRTARFIASDSQRHYAQWPETLGPLGHLARVLDAEMAYRIKDPLHPHAVDLLRRPRR